MGNIRQPRHGSMQFWPRKRAKRVIPRIRSWVKSADAKPLGFYGYKVQMCHAMVIDNKPTSRTKGETLSLPITVLECPPLRLLSVRFYKKTSSGLRVATEIMLSNDKRIRLPMPKTVEPKLDSIKIEDYAQVRVIAFTQSNLTSRGQKAAELFELALGGSPAEQFAWVKEHANKEIRVRDVFAEGEQVDITAVTKGKGFQGTVKRFHVKIRQHKSEKVKRGIGSLGAWHPKRVLFTVPQSGKMGFHTRSDRNKWILKISDENINPNGGFNHYGLIKNEYIMLKGSVPGPCKRLIRLVKSRNPRRSTPKDAPIIESVIVR